MWKCNLSGAIQVGNAYLTAKGLCIGSTKVSVEDWDDFSLVVKFCKPYIESALATTFDSNLGELYELSPGRLGLRPGLSPQAQFAEVAQSFRGNSLKTKILIGWCVLLNLDIQFKTTQTDEVFDEDVYEDRDDDLDEELDDEITEQDLGAIASYYLSWAWESAFKAPIPQHRRGRLVDIPKDVRDSETALYNRHRFDTPAPVSVPGIGSSTQLSAFGISAMSWGDILVTPSGTHVGVFISHFVESKTDLSDWLVGERFIDKVITMEENGESLRFRVQQNKGYACFRLQPAQAPGIQIHKHIQ